LPTKWSVGVAAKVAGTVVGVAIVSRVTPAVSESACTAERRAVAVVRDGQEDTG